MTVVAGGGGVAGGGATGGGGAAGDRVPSGPATSRSIYILHWISRVSSTLAVLFLWLSWLVVAERLVTCPV
jgi:hypothetical protein